MENESRGSLPLSLLKRAHGLAVSSRRVRVLAKCLAAKIPPYASVLDIGCGDGAVAHLIARQNTAASIRGIEFAPRPTCLIECAPFDGATIPYPPASFDVCMFVDVLHHTHGILPLLSEACRVSRRFVLIKDHLAEGRFDFKTLQFMDWIGNRPHGVVLPYNYQSRVQWNQYFSTVGLTIRDWQNHIPLYPPPFGVLFGRQLHFVALLEKIESSH
jgi:SAM-dependent methyltransferase